jgi:amidohydrolase
VAYDFFDELPALLDSANDTMVDIRHDLHQHPETSWQEVRTTKVIRERLAALDWVQAYCPTSTGAVATLDTGKPGKSVLIRADIDGLPVTEERDLSYASKTEGAMHACGHDIHTAALLGIADMLGSRRDELVGKFVLIFQPAEEGLGGAKAMIEGGVLEQHPVDAAIGIHVTSLAPVGFVATRPGPLMSEATGFVVHFRGKGGHGAMASADGNVVLAISHLAPLVGGAVEGLSLDGTNCACSAGVLHAGTAKNVVPRTALLRGTLRTFDADQKRQAWQRLEAFVEETSRAFGVECELREDDNTPVVNNDPHITELVEASAKRFVGDANYLRIPPTSPSDDMSEFLNRVPGCYLFVGGALSDGSSGMHHSPDFAVDDGALRVAAGLLASAAVDLAQG